MTRRRMPAPPVLTAAFVLLALAAGSRPSVAQMGAGRPPTTSGSSPTEARPSPAATPSNAGGASPPAAPAPPFDLKDQTVIDQGSTLFAGACSYCHKRLQSTGGTETAPTLRDRAYEREYLFKMIAEGPPSRRMPAWKHQYSTDQIWKLVAYILSLQGAEGQPK